MKADISKEWPLGRPESVTKFVKSLTEIPDFKTKLSLDSALTPEEMAMLNTEVERVMNEN